MKRRIFFSSTKTYATRVRLPLVGLAARRARFPRALACAAAACCCWMAPAAARALPTARLIAVGDIMLSRGVATRLRRHGPDYPFLKVAGYLRGADLVFGNLECTLMVGPPVAPRALVFRADPAEAAALRAAGFSVLSLANNHAPNYGGRGLLSTFAALRQAGIAYAGAGPNAAAAHQAVVLERHGIRFAFLAYGDGSIVPPGYAAAPAHPGIAFLDVAAMQRDVRQARHSADVVIVSMHAGQEYAPRPIHRQVAFAHAAIAAGADLVLGHHPHVVQTAEQYRGKMIFYSLGNFIFDQTWSRATRQGMTVALTFTRAGLQGWEPHPVRIVDAAQPQLLSGPEALAVDQRLNLPLPAAAPAAPVSPAH